MLRNNASNGLKDKMRKGAGLPVSDKGNQCIKPEDNLRGGTYTFTFNPEDQPDITICESFKEWWSVIHSVMNQLKGAKVRMWLELSQKGRWHFHGLIKIYNPLKFYLYDIHKLNEEGHYEIDTYDGYDGFAYWLQYCVKQQSLVEEYIIRELFPLPDIGRYYPNDSFIDINTMVNDCQ